MNGLPVGDRQIRVSMAKTGLSQPSTPSSPSPLPPYEVLAAQAQAHIMSGPGFMMQPNLGPMHPNLGPLPGMPPGMMPLPPLPPPGPKPQRRPHQDPGKVGRTVYLENVAADIDEQVSLLVRHRSATCETFRIFLASAIGCKLSVSKVSLAADAEQCNTSKKTAESYL